MESVFLFKVLPYLVYIVAIFLAIGSSVMVYAGLSTQNERLQTRLRIKQSVQKNKEKISDSAHQSVAEEWLKKAGYPFGLNSLKYHIIFLSFILFLLINYVVFPMLSGQNISVWALLIIVTIFVLLLPNFPYSLFVYVVKRIIDFREAKKNTEVFMLYDLIINELEMMSNSRINTYNIIKNIKPYFEVIDTSLNRLLTTWTSNEGPKIALENFGNELGSKEAKSLVNIMKTLDDVDIETALKSLRGMNNIFVRSQIENYRRRRKVTTDLANIPIKSTHFLIILNFLLVIIMMVSMLMDTTKM